MPAEPVLDDAIHAPNRLRLCGLLRRVDAVDFSAAREALGMSDSALSKTIRSLVEVGYVQTEKVTSTARGDLRRTMSVALTDAGRRAFDGHVAALRSLASGPGGE